MVDAAVAHHLEVLGLVPLGRLSVVERVRHADAFDRALLDAVDEDRLGQARHLQNGRRDVDHMMELVRISPLALIPFGQCTIVPLRVPPKCEATCLVHW